MMAHTRIVTLLAAALAAGCTSERLIANQAPLSADAGSPDVSVDVSADRWPTVEDAPSESEPDAHDAGPVRREILVRSPFGNLDKTGNLLLDGDFEWTGRDGQNPWATVNLDEQVPLEFATGGQCRSGLRCVRLRPDLMMLGVGIAPTNAAMRFSMWIRVPGDSCDVLTVLIVYGMTYRVSWIAPDIESETVTPDERGWCHLRGTHPAMDESVLVYVETKGIARDDEVVLDDAVLEPIDGLSPLVNKSLTPPAQLADRARRAAQWFVEHQRFPSPPHRTDIASGAASRANTTQTRDPAR